MDEGSMSGGADKAKVSRAPVDIIVPLYRNLALSRRCVESVLAHTDMSTARLILINDASPEAALADWCASLASREDTLVITHADNQGFVVSVNTGMALSEDRDVVLLNSDTEVPPGWLQRLATAAASDPRIATLTPFSNNGSICSYPHFCAASALPAGLDLASLDALVAEANRGRLAELPTAVGFCMYIRREALQRCGLFDAERYGRGYGEENDFSMRVAAAGMRNVLCADLFVYHEGGVSFGESRQALMRRAEELLVARYPDYPKLVAAFVASDPLRELRDAVDIRRLAVAGQGLVLQGEWQTARDTLLEQQQANAALLLRYADRCDEYQSLLDKERSASRAESARYAALLAECRAEYAATAQALATRSQQLEEVGPQLSELTQQHEQTQHHLDVAEHQLAHLNGLAVVRLRRWLKRMLSRS